MTITTRLAAAACGGREIRLFAADRLVDSVAYEQLHTDAGRVACGLMERGLAEEERVAIALPTSSDFGRAFFGVLAAGGVAVPLPPPMRFGSLSGYGNRITRAMAQSRVSILLTSPQLTSPLRDTLADQARSVRVLGIDELMSTDCAYREIAADRPAVVQYTSGTIGAPKGVVLSHENILSNIESIRLAVEGSVDDVCCSWLPLFHDMGLIGKFLFAACNGMNLCMISPEDFLRDPGRWLRMISSCRGTLASSPSSGYAFTTRRATPESIAGLDLSSWRLALNGAETIDPDVVRAFGLRFGRAGFRTETFLPVYGLAEASLAVTAAPLRRGLRSVWISRAQATRGPVDVLASAGPGDREVVSVGSPIPGTSLRIVDRTGVVVNDDVVGDIEITGPSVTSGYDNDAATTAQVVGPDGWVATGDLGFQRNGELFVTGRSKEIVIVRGQNYFAGDIESVLASLPGVSDAGVLVTECRDVDGHGLAVYVETRAVDESERTRLSGKVRATVSETFGVVPQKVVLLRRGKLPRTSSGKLERRRYPDESYAEPARSVPDLCSRRLDVQ